MKKQFRWALGLFVIALALPAWPQENPKTVSLSLQDCIAQTLKNNLGVAIQVLNPLQAENSVALAKEFFLPTFALGFTKQNSTSVSYSFITAAGSVTYKTNNYSFSATQNVPFGGQFSLSATGYSYNSNQSYQTINPRYGTTLSFNFTQPLLQNFGYDISRYNILVARNGLATSDSQLKQTLLDTIYSVESAYWALVYSIENLSDKQYSVQLAKDLLEKNQRSVEVGIMAPMDVLTAEAEIATREADLIQAETQVKSAEDQLKVLLNMPEDEQRAIGSIKALDSPDLEERKVSLDEALATAFQLRADLATSKLGIELQQLNVRYARNQVLPALNLSASYSGSGVSGTEILYDGNPVLGAPIIGTIPGNFSGAIKDTLAFKYPGWYVGLTLSIPVSDFISRAILAQARVNLQHAMLNLQNTQQQAVLEIKNAIRAVESNFKRITAYKVARALAEQKLVNEEEKLKVGQSTNYMVLSYQRDLADAKASELNAIIAYNVSLASLDHSLGVSLRNRNVKLTDYIQN
ncbi:MAG: TolC family protein [Candidatus Aminicenantales bacterium]|jgi:outer membrane protein TolC